jgi:CRISPR-associated endoribonuclease Cas6
MTTQSLISNSPDLYALIIHLTAAQTGTLRATQGHLAHAAFHQILHQVDPAVAKAIHDMHGRKPFTISPIHGFGHGRQGRLSIRAGQSGSLRITLLDPTIFHTFIHYFLQGGRQTQLRLDHMHFQTTEILSTPGSHPLAGYTSLAELHTCWEEVALTPAHQTIHLDFQSPTAFSLRNESFRHMHILPDPSLVFGELAGYWDRLTGSDTQSAVRDYATFGVVVARHNIETHMYEYRNSKQIGFTGSVSFKLMDKDSTALARHLNRLADLAFYTGVGYKTTMGMGQVSRIKN